MRLFRLIALLMYVFASNKREPTETGDVDPIDTYI